MLVLTIWPLFALIILGHALFRCGLPDRAFWPAAEKLNYFVLFPALLVANLADAPIGDPALLRMGGAIVTVIAIAFALCLALRALRGWPARRFGVVVQATVRFNTYLGLALVGSLFGPEGLSRAAVLLAIAVPTVNVLSVYALTADGEERSLGALLRPIATNPLILACVAGILIALSGVGLPFGLDRFSRLLASASLPLGLLCVGAALDLKALRAETGPLAALGLARLLVVPVLAALVAAGFGLDAATTGVLVVFTAIPTATASYVLTTQLDGDYRLMAGVVTLQTLASVASLPLVLGLLA